MGVIVEPKNYQRWLEPGEVHSLPFDLLRPYPEEDMKSWRVSDKVGNTRNNWAELIEPIPEDQPKRERPSRRAKQKKDPPSQGLFDSYLGLIRMDSPRIKKNAPENNRTSPPSCPDRYRAVWRQPLFPVNDNHNSRWLLELASLLFLLR
jgi:hypothetical protein